MTTATPIWRLFQNQRGIVAAPHTREMPDIPIEGKWPRVWTLAFLLVVCGAFWLAVGGLFIVFSRQG